MSVRVRDMIIASVACKGIFRRYAQLSAEEQAEVVNRVKAKLKKNGGESNDETVIDGEAAADTVLDADNQNSEEVESEGGDELSEEDIAAIDEIAGGSESEVEEGEAEGEVEGGDELSEEDIAAIDEIAGGSESEVEEGGDEEAEGSDEELTDDIDDGVPDEEDLDADGDDVLDSEDDSVGGEADNQSGLMAIVDGLGKEVEQIKSDGKIDPSEVMGLFDNMMSMVTLLVHTKAPKEA